MAMAHDTVNDRNPASPCLCIYVRYYRNSYAFGIVGLQEARLSSGRPPYESCSKLLVRGMYWDCIGSWPNGQQALWKELLTVAHAGTGRLASVLS